MKTVSGGSADDGGDDSGRQIPEPWLTAMESAGGRVLDPRTGVPSANALAREMGVSSATVWKVFRGKYARGASADTVARMAAALKVRPETVAKWVDQSWTEFKPFELPPEADLLPEKHREAVRQLVRLLAEPYNGKFRADDVDVTEAEVAEKKVAGRPKSTRQNADVKSRANPQVKRRKS